MEVAGTNVRRLVVGGGAAMLLAIGAGACGTDDANDAINEAQKLDPQSTEELEAAQAEAQQAYEDARARADATKRRFRRSSDEAGPNQRRPAGQHQPEAPAGLRGPVRIDSGFQFCRPG